MNWFITMFSLVSYFLGMAVGFYWGREYEKYKNNKYKWDQDAH